MVLWEEWKNLKIKRNTLLYEEGSSGILFRSQLQNHFPWMLYRGVKIRRLHQFQGMICSQIFHSDSSINLFVDIWRNGKKYTRSLHHLPIVTMIYDLYKADFTRRIKSNIWGIPRAYNFPPVTKLVGGIHDGTASTYFSIITMTPAIPVATNSATKSTNRSTSIITRSTTSISLQKIRYTRNCILQSVRRTKYQGYI